METLKREVGAWEAKRKEAKVTMGWQFTTADVRVQLKRLSPMIKEQNSTSQSHMSPFHATRMLTECVFRVEGGDTHLNR